MKKIMFSNYEKLDDLLHQKKTLERKVCAIEGDLKSGLDPQREEQAVQLENYEVLLELLRISESELARINKKIISLENKM